jgi:thymidylate synthase (FAD)
MTKTLTVLDKGFVRYVEGMGFDQGVVDAARVSYKSEAKTADEDKKLIAYLLKHKHGTPFEHAVLKFHVKAPLFVARQWFRHRMASYNETSFRYREAPEEFYVPEKWRAQDTKNKQGSIETPDLNHKLWSNVLADHNSDSMKVYHAMIKSGVTREMARMALPVNLYTEFYWTVNARSLMNFLDLRSDGHAQWEMRQFSHALAHFTSIVMPWTFGAFTSGLKAENGYAEMYEALSKLELVGSQDRAE